LCGLQQVLQPRCAETIQIDLEDAIFTKGFSDAGTRAKEHKTMLNLQQQRVYDWLNNELGLPVFAEAYKGAATFVEQKPSGYISFVAHAGRDLMNCLASTVANIKPSRVQYQQHIDELQSHWREEWRLSNELSPDTAEGGHLIPIVVCQKISTLIEDHKSGRVRSADADGLFFSTFLDYSDKEKIPKNFVLEWKRAKEWFLGHVHLRGKPFNKGVDDALRIHFKCLESYLYIAASSQYDRLRNLNEILETTN
jgi:hypothetical protein